MISPYSAWGMEGTESAPMMPGRLGPGDSERSGVGEHGDPAGGRRGEDLAPTSRLVASWPRSVLEELGRVPPLLQEGKTPPRRKDTDGTEGL